MNNRDERTALKDNEHLTGSDAQVSVLLRSLPRADAPKDFEFKVKARITQTAPTASSRPGYIKAIGYSAPFILLLMVAAVFLIRQPESGQEVIASQTSPGPSIQEAAPSPFPEAPAVVASNPSAVSKAPDVAKAISTPGIPEPLTRSTRAAANDNSQPGGSYDTSASQANTILPRGFPQKPFVKRSNARPPSVANVDIAETLKTFGIDAALESAGWTVKGVAADSISDKSGLKAGDVIDSLDERPLTGKTLKGRVEVKSLKVVRDGKPVEITFGPR